MIRVVPGIRRGGGLLPALSSPIRPVALLQRLLCHSERLFDDRYILARPSGSDYGRRKDSNRRL
jgi:hypothetical protein